MTTKLTLSVEKSTIGRAKLYAKNTGRSLSELIENYLESLTAESKDEQAISPKLRKIAGVVNLPTDFDEDTELKAYFESKHLGK